MPSTESSPATHDAVPTLVLGVLGGIASGKSRAAELLAGSEGVVVAADALAHEVLDSIEVRALLVERFGTQLLDGEGAVDRPALARIVFADPQARRELEGWTHPRVRARILEELSQARQRGVPRVVLDVPLLLETSARPAGSPLDAPSLPGLCDLLVFVDAPTEVREQRARERRGWPAGEVARREAAQIPLDEKRERADHVLPNTGTEDELIEAIEALNRRIGWIARDESEGGRANP